jgi:hypothetical protein
MQNAKCKIQDAKVQMAVGILNFASCISLTQAASSTSALQADAGGCGKPTGQPRDCN